MAADVTDGLLVLLGGALGVSVTHVRRLAGGMSARSDLLLAGGRPVVLRRHGDWSVGFDDGVADRESAMFRLGHAAGVAPQPLWAGDLLGRTALVVEAVDGHPLLTPDDPFDWAQQLASVLARIHAITPDGDALAHIAAAPLSPQEQPPEPQMFEHPDAERLFARLGELERSNESVFIHGDYWPGNTIWKDNELVAVIDWEAAEMGDPASDVAYCACDLHYYGLPEAANLFVETYKALTHRTLDSLPYWTVAALCRPLPDIAQWLPSWEGLGRIEDVEVARERHRRLITDTLR